MSKIFLNRNRVSLGQFTEESVAEGLRRGRFLPTDLGWREGMEGWKPLSEFTDLKEAEKTEFVEPEDFLPPLPPPDVPLSPAWERKEQLGVFAALWETMRDVMLNPTVTFQNMKQEGGFWRPLSFLMLLGIPSVILGLVWVVLIDLPNFSPTTAQQAMFGGEMTRKFMFWGLIGEMVLSPILLPLGAFISAGITHLCLMLVGGANKPFETTFRVYCYVTGSLYVFLILPILGTYIYVIWVLIAFCIGLREAHGTDIGRVIMAVLMPIVICCGLGIIVMLIPALAAALRLHS